MAVTIRISNGYEIKLDKDKLLSLFPTSLLATTLDMDPDVEVIELSMKFITPEVLDLVRELVETRCTPAHVNDSTQLIEAGKYLLMDILIVMGNPKYKEYTEAFPRKNLLDPTYDVFHRIKYALRTGYASLYTYLYPYVNDDGLRYELLTMSVVMNQLDRVKELLSDGTLNITEVPIYTSEFFTHQGLKVPHMVKVSLVAETVSKVNILGYALDASCDLFQYLLDHYSEEISEALNDLIYDTYHRPDLLNLIVRHPKFHYTDYTPNWLYRGIALMDAEALRLSIQEKGLKFEMAHADLLMFRLFERFYTVSIDTWNLQEYLAEQDRFYGNYEDSMEKAKFLAGSHPIFKEYYDAYTTLQAGHTPDTCRFNISKIWSLFLVIHGEHAPLVSEFLTWINNDTTGGFIHPFVTFAVYCGQPEIITCVLERVNLVWSSHTSELRLIYNHALSLAQLKHPELIPLITSYMVKPAP